IQCFIYFINRFPRISTLLSYTTLFRSPGARAQLGFDERFGKGTSHAHDLAGGFHLRPKDGIDTRELDEGEYRFLDRIIWRNNLAGHALLLESPARHAASCDLGQLDAASLGNEWHGTGGTRIHFQYINNVALNGKLYVHEPANAQCLGHEDGL